MTGTTNPFLGLHSPVMPMGLVKRDDAQLVRLESNAGRIVEVPAALPVPSLTQLCGGSSWLTSQFPQRARGAGPRGDDIVVGFDPVTAARALIDACACADRRRLEWQQRADRRNSKERP